MLGENRPIVLVHGLWNSPYLFNRLRIKLEERGLSLFIPHLPHKYGRVSISTLARNLDIYITTRFAKEVNIDLVGFSMGGLVCRAWLQNMNGAERTSRFISIGSPHKGTLMAQFVPSWILAGVAEMKRGSNFLRELNQDYKALNQVECISFFCAWDLMVIPGWEARAPVGTAVHIPVLTHKCLIRSPRAINILLKEILRKRH